jgi:hypothetical protein
MSTEKKPEKKVVFISFPDLNQEDVNELMATMGRYFNREGIKLPYTFVAIGSNMIPLSLQDLKALVADVEKQQLADYSKDAQAEAAKYTA